MDLHMKKWTLKNVILTVLLQAVLLEARLDYLQILSLESLQVALMPHLVIIMGIFLNWGSRFYVVERASYLVLLC